MLDLSRSPMRRKARTRLPWIFVLLLLLSACSNSGNGLKAPGSQFDDLHPDTTGKRSIPSFQAAIEARKLAGDTSLTDVQRLRRVLTDSIAGYRLEIDLADTLKMPLSTMCEAKKVFYNQDGGYIELALGDYIHDPEFMLVGLHRHNLADSVEVQGVLEERVAAPGLQPAKALDAFSWRSWNKARGAAYVYVGVDQRYFLSIEANPHAGMLDLAQVAAWLDWSGLSLVK